MSRSGESGHAGAQQKKQTYHHGDLRLALLDAAREVLERDGIEQLSLRSVARQAGVSHAAPYHHFPDKAALIGALALDGYARFIAAFRHVEAQYAGQPLERLLGLGVAYVRFAVDHPDLFRLMFRPELRSTSEGAELSEVDRAGDLAHEILREAVLACQRAGIVSDADPEALTLTAWATVHGLAVLLLDGPLGKQREEPGTVEGLSRLVAGTLAQGLLARQAAERQDSSTWVE